MYFLLQFRGVVIENLTLFFRQFVGLDCEANQPFRHFHIVFYFLPHTLMVPLKCKTHTGHFPGIKGLPIP